MQDADRYDDHDFRRYHNGCHHNNPRSLSITVKLFSLMKNVYRHLVILLVLISNRQLLNAQLFDSLEAKAGIEYRFSSQPYQPFWLVANKYGTVADRKSDMRSYARIVNKQVIAEPEYQNEQGFYSFNPVSVSYGLSLYTNNHFKSTLLEEAFAKLEYKKWSLRVGRFEETTGGLDPELSTGSLGISPNALPIPKIGLAVTDFVNVPFTNNWLQFKGTFAHGWLGSDRYYKNSYYHEKTFFLRVGARRLKVYGGIEHFVEWGGSRAGQQANQSTKGFWNAFLGKSSDPGADGGREGDQRGVIEGGLYWENDNILLHAYLQKPFEGRQDISLKNKNALAGLMLSVKNTETGLQKIVAEIISTKDVNDYIDPARRESYYNNNVYKTGWEYKNQVIGTPLFLNRTRAAKYFSSVAPFNWDAPDTEIPPNANIINNRVFAFHLAALVAFSDVLTSKTMLTFTTNYGSINSDELFSPARKQFYGLQQIRYDLPKNNLTLIAGVGIEAGQLGSSAVTGGLLGIEWNLTANKNYQY
jgi:hypothetical protein